MSKLAAFLGRYPQFDLAVESAIRHNVLGGICFAGALFIFWIQGAKPGGQEVRRRLLTTFLGSSLAIILTIVSGHLISWVPPSRSPSLGHFYPMYLSENINDNSFPSQSTALYAAVAAGIFSLHKVVGSALWAGVAVLVSLPRLYVGGHYPTDVLTGLVLGIFGYFIARTCFEPSLSLHLERLLDQDKWAHLLGEFVVFIWILETAVEFREGVWIKNALQYILK
jgi:membrane-associated phospholipid phosphatase